MDLMSRITSKQQPATGLYRVDRDWTRKTKAAMSIPWTSPTACLRKKINGELAQQNGSRAVSAPRDKDEQNTV